jgi:hypothetical protein
MGYATQLIIYKTLNIGTFILQNVFRKRSLIIPLVIVVVEVIIFFRMFLYQGYIQWGNFGFPLRPDILNSLKSLTWNPYVNDGLPVETPWISLFGNISSASIILLGGLWNLNIAVKIYIFFSTFFMAYAFYLLIGRFSKSLIARGSSVVFILANPLSLQFVGQGDPFQFIIWGIYFLSLFFLLKSSEITGRKEQLYLFLSVIFLSLTVSIPQIFYLGSVLYAILIFYSFVVDKRRLKLDGLKRFVKILVATFFLLVLLIMPLILTTLYGEYNLSPNSVIANPLNNFIAYSASFPNLFLMNSYPMLNTTVLLGNLSTVFLSYFWSIITIVFVIVIFASGVIFVDGKMLFLELVIISAALFGSGYASPISAVNTYLYIHMFGYQVLNTSYYWEWLIIIPLYAILTGMLVDHLVNFASNFEFKTTTRDTIFFEKFEHKHRIALNLFPSQSKVALIVVLAVVAMLIAPPLAGQGFYGGGNVGIHPTNVPESYSQLVQNLSDLVGNSSLGVAYFTPDSYVFFGNNTNGVSQPLLNDPGVRSPGVPNYLAPPIVSINFFYWLYTEFYLNETHNVAQLFSIMGIKYFVTLNSVISASSLYVANSENATQLMQYQNDVRLLYSNPDYSVFESTLNVNVANSAQGLTLMSGNYNSLSGAAALGVNISKMVPVFTGDLNSSNFNFFLNNTKSMIFFNSGSLLTLAIDRYTNSSDTIDPLSFTNNYYYSPYQGWMSSTGLETSNNNYILSDPYPFAITATNKSMSSNFTTGSSGNYTFYAQVLLSQPDSKMQFTIDGLSTQIDSNIQGFQWIRIPFHTNSSKNELSIKSLSGLNGIQRIVIVKSGLIGDEIVTLQQFAKSRGIPVLYLNNSGYAQIDETGKYPIMVDLTNSQNKSTGTYDQLITVPESYYGNDANPDLSNLQWQYSNGSVIPSWMQSFNNTSATWWLKIANIPPFGHMNIFLTIYPKNTNVLNAETTGESPLINPRYNDGASVFQEFNSSGLIGSGTGQYYPTNAGLFFYAKFYDPTGIPGNQALAGWSYDTGIDTPMFAALTNTSYVRPFYYVNNPHYLLPHASDGQYYLFGMAVEYPEAYWYINDKVVQTANSSSFVNSSGTYVRPTGVNVSILYSFMTNLPPNNVMPSISIQNVNYSQKVSIINNDLTSQKSVEVINNPNGYEVKNITTKITVVKYGYFSGMKETVKGFQVYPIMGDLSFVLVSYGGANTANFVSIDYNLLLYGVIVYVLAIAVPTTYFVIGFRKERKSGGKK